MTTEKACVMQVKRLNAIFLLSTSIQCLANFPKHSHAQFFSPSGNSVFHNAKHLYNLYDIQISRMTKINGY